MDFLAEYNKIIKEQPTLALATSVQDQPNVRIVNFIADQQKAGVVYFSTFKGNTKIGEFDKNAKVSFTTIPLGNSTAHVRVSKACVKASTKSIYDLLQQFVQKISDYNEIVEQAGDQLIVYEIHFQSALVILDHMNRGEIKFPS